MDAVKQEEEQLEANARLQADELASTKFGYDDFILAFEVPKPASWFGFEVRVDGVYVAVPPNDDPIITPLERASSTWHHEKDLTMPALKFPYTLRDLHRFVVDYKLESIIPSDELHWLIKVIPEAGVDVKTDGNARYKQLSRQQDHAILKRLEELKHDPTRLPPIVPGKRGVKSECRASLDKSPLFKGVTTFDRAWERLLGNKDIAYAESKNPTPPK